MNLRTLLGISAFFLTIFPTVVLPQENNTISFTETQVANGKTHYREHCQLCHGSSLANGQFGTPLRGSFFRNNWKEKSLGELIQFTYESMPPDNVKLLSPQQYAEVVAYILSRNDISAGDVEISGNYEQQKSIKFPWD